MMKGARVQSLHAHGRRLAVGTQQQDGARTGGVVHVAQRQLGARALGRMPGEVLDPQRLDLLGTGDGIGVFDGVGARHVSR
jgi:hypothetical protein